MQPMSKHSVQKVLVAMLSLIAVSFGLVTQLQPAGAVSHTPPAEQMPSTTLRLAVADADDAPSAPSSAFVEQVQQRSGGSLSSTGGSW